MIAREHMPHPELASLDRLGAIAIVLDHRGVVVDWTRACEQAIARTPDELRGRPLWELADAPDVEPLRRVLAAVVADGRPRPCVAWLVGRSGERRTAARRGRRAADRRPSSDPRHRR